MSKKRVGILGYGALGKYLVEKIQSDPVVSERLELAFVWNRTVEVMLSDSSLPRSCILEKIEDFEPFKADLVVEVSHPNITKNYASLFIEAGCDFFCGSPTVFAEEQVETQLRHLVSKKKSNGIYLPVGALWGAEDIQRMANRGTLFGLKITMKFHPDSLKLVGDLSEKLASIIGKPGEHVLYEGNVRGLCPLAPNNTNTMACAAMGSLYRFFSHETGWLWV